MRKAKQKPGPELISQSEAALLIGAERRTIRYWESRGWLAVAQQVAPPTGKRGRPGKLYDRAEVIRVAAERGRQVQAPVPKAPK